MHTSQDSLAAQKAPVTVITGKKSAVAQPDGFVLEPEVREEDDDRPRRGAGGKERDRRHEEHDRGDPQTLERATHP